jgi:hypothetical protein
MAEVLNTQYQGDLGATRQQANEDRRRAAKEKNMARLMEQSKRLPENSDQWQASRTSGAMPPLINTGPRSDAQGTASSAVEDAGTEGGEQSPNFFRRRLDALRGKGKEEKSEKDGNVLQQQAEEKIKKEIAKKLSWRAFNMAMGASVILVFVTIIVWTVQFIGGNMMGSKMIPKLGIGETILWLIGLIIMVALFDMIILAITLMIEVFEDPRRLVGELINIFWKDFWAGLVGN